MQFLRRMLAAAFAGDRHVWRVAAVAGAIVVAVTAFYCLKPRSYFTGTDDVESYTYVAAAPAGAPVCAAGLRLPAHTGIVRLQLISRTQQRPALRMTLHTAAGTSYSQLAPEQVPSNRISRADFSIAPVRTHAAGESASLCLTAGDVVNWGGTPLSASPANPATDAGVPLTAKLAIWYLPPGGEKRSYVHRAGEIFRHAALFRPGIIGAWTYPLLLLLVLPLIALLAVRCLAVAVSGRVRRLGAWLFVIAAVNACCWAVITPVFQAPDEVDHFAYVQSLVERGEGPSHDAGSPLPRWSSSESFALKEMAFPTDHQVGDTRPPWLSSEQQAYTAAVARTNPSESDGGGYTTSAGHGPLYYLALAPAYLVARHSSVFAQLTLMRFTSALIGALVVLFTYLLVRELAPGRPWLAVLAALLVAFEPMYGFISGIVNNDVGVNAGAAALELLLIRLLRRGITIPSGALTGAVLVALPIIKGTGLSLYPVAALVFLVVLWRHHTRRDMYGWLALALAAVVVGEISAHILNMLQPAAAATGSTVISSNASAVSEALHHIPSFLSYLWQAFLPRLSFMSPHFPPGSKPGYVIFIQRGWGAFGWYDVFFPRWVYVAIAAAIVLALPLAGLAAWREWSWLRRNWIEVLVVVAMPVAVIAGFEAAYYTPGVRPAIAEFGRYAFPGIGPLAVLAVGALHAFGRTRMLTVGVGLLVAMIALSYAGQLLTLTSFYA